MRAYLLPSSMRCVAIAIATRHSSSSGMHFWANHHAFSSSSSAGSSTSPRSRRSSPLPLRSSAPSSLSSASSPSTKIIAAAKEINNANASPMSTLSSSSSSSNISGHNRIIRRPPARTAASGKDLFPCTAFCTASTYNADQLLDLLSRWHFPTVYSNDIIHVDFGDAHHPPTPPQHIRPPLPTTGEAFYFFKDGCVICWNMNVPAERLVLESLRPFEIERVREPETEEMDYTYSKTPTMKGDTIVLSSSHDAADGSDLTSTSATTTNAATTNAAAVGHVGNGDIMEKIAFSYGLQRSVKLAVIESMVDKVIESVKHVPQELVVKRKLHMSSRQVMHTIGQLLYLRGSLNMHSPLSETPEMYWEQPEFERLFNQITKQLDLKSRIAITNSKIDYSQELVEVLRTHLSEKRGTNMEIAIIALIFVEVVFEVMHWMGFKKHGEDAATVAHD